MSAARIFISYRRADSAGWAGRLHSDLRQRFGDDRVFRDVTIAPGVDFRDHIEGVMDGCEVVLAVIGPRWATVTGPDGRPRLGAPDDLVRLEIERALGRPDVHVIPVLVDGASIPAAEDLPEGLRPLSRRNAVELTDLRWEYDVDRLCEYLHSVLGESMVSATVPRPEEPAPAVHRRAAGPQAWSMATALVAGAALAGLIGAALTQDIYDERPTRAIEVGLPAWQWLAELGKRLGPYAGQRAIEVAVVVAAVLAVTAAVHWRAGGAGPSRRVVVWGLCTGALAGLADAITYMLLRYVAGWFDHPLNLGVSRAVGAALVGVVVARAVRTVRTGSAGVAALAAAGGAFLVGVSSEALGVQRVGVAALQAALVVGAAAAVALAPRASGQAAPEPATSPPGAAGLR